MGDMEYQGSNSRQPFIANHSILSAPMRKRTGNRLVILLVWSSYFLAEWAASFALRLITSTQSSKHGENSDLYAFWASFLLLHHGGPDTITAFEENELWLRHLVSLINQVGFTRVSVLNEPDPRLDYAKLMGAFSSKKVARLPTTMSQTLDADIKELKSAMYSSQPREKQGSLDGFEVVKYGYHFLNILKGLIVDFVSYEDQYESKVFFYGRSRFPEDALQVLEVELNFIYEILYTKVLAVQSYRAYVFRTLTLVSILASLGIFFSLDCKNDWTIASFNKKPTTNSSESSVLWTIFKKYLTSKCSWWSLCKDESGNEFVKRATPVSLRRWSESVAGFNLIAYCLKQISKKSNEENDQCCLGIYKKTTYLWHRIWRICCKNVVKPLGAQDFLDEWKYASKKPFTLNLWKFIFHELLRKSKEADQPENIKKISSARGAYVLDCKNKLGGEVVLFETLKTDYIENVTFDESLLLWHIATELCYHESEVDHDKKAQPDEQELDYHGSEVDQDKKSQPDEHKHVSHGSIGDIRYRDTCAEAKRFFHNKGLGPKNKEKDACENLLTVNTDVKPIYIKGDKSKSVLFDACILAKELQKLKGIEKWEVISKVWVEMLSYASNHCRPDAHVHQVSRGGQLISLVWLLMAHFGLVEQYVFTADFGPAKLIVEK
ncbi:hypothetical protein I3760_15G051100 [Carya illinoinensis]|nr:hypothetical protein I3760_15G051100 [Carya illinoinensis]